MHKQFQKFGLFVSKNFEEETQVKNNKTVKYLYKNQAGTTENSHKRKVKSGNDADTGRFSLEDKHRSRRKRSTEHTDKNHRKQASETEIYFISPEEIKTHRKKSREKPSEQLDGRRKHSGHRRLTYDAPERKKTQREDDIAKLIKKSHKEVETDDYQCLTKKEIFKLLSNPKEVPKTTSTGSKFFKKFFVFDKQEPEFRSHGDKHSRKINHYCEDTNLKKIKPLEDSTTRKLEKICRSYDKKFFDSTHVSKKHHDRNKLHENHDMKNHTGIDKNDEPSKDTKKRKSRPTDPERLIFEELKSTENKNEKIKSSKKSKMNKKEQLDQIKEKSKTRTKSKQRLKSTENLKEESQNNSRVNPQRHKFCLVKNTFSLVEITPTKECDSVIEKKKKTETFKKYYNYSRNQLDRDSEITNTSTHKTFSDSHKMYQDASESIDDISNRPKGTKRLTSKQSPNLKLEAHVSSFVVTPETKIFQKTSKQSKKPAPQKSRIPVLNSSAKIIEMTKEPVTSPKSPRKRATLSASSKPKDKVLEVSRSPRKQRSFTSIRASSDKSEGVPKKVSNLKSLQINAREEMEATEKTPRTKIDRKSLKVNRTSTVTKINKDSVVEKKMESKTSPVRKNKPTTSTNRNLLLLPTLPNQKQTPVKSPLMLSPHRSSSGWIKSDRSRKTILTSKSDTKLHRNSRARSRKKYKTLDNYSARSTWSNSTCGEKSIESTKTGTSFFLTKSYKDDDKLSRWQKRKMYSDTIRKKFINKNQKESALPRQVLEVRYLTMNKHNSRVIDAPEKSFMIEDKQEALTSLSTSPRDQSKETIETELEDITIQTKEFYDDDLPQPCFDLVENEKFKELFELPIDKALSEILCENHNFLKKDFSLTVYEQSSCSDDDISSDDLSLDDKKENEWYHFRIPADHCLSEISCCRENSCLANNQNLNFESEDHIIDSLSAPGSEESGYSTIRSRRPSRSFFQRPDIKALFETPLDSVCVELQIETTSSSNCGLEIRSIESKSLQTATIECSQKSVQITMSKEEIAETLSFANQTEETFVEGQENECEETLKVDDKSETNSDLKIDCFNRLQEGLKSVTETNNQGQSNESQDKHQIEETPTVDDKIETNVSLEIDDCFKPYIKREDDEIKTDKLNEKIEMNSRKKSRNFRRKFKKKLSFLSCFGRGSPDK